MASTLKEKFNMSKTMDSFSNRFLLKTLKDLNPPPLMPKREKGEGEEKKRHQRTK